MEAVIDVGILGRNGQIVASIARGPTPLLLSRPALTELGVQMDYAKHAICIPPLGVRAWQPMRRSLSGHHVFGLYSTSERPRRRWTDSERECEGANWRS